MNTNSQITWATEHYPDLQCFEGFVDGRKMFLVTESRGIVVLNYQNGNELTQQHMQSIEIAKKECEIMLTAGNLIVTSH